MTPSHFLRLCFLGVVVLHEVSCRQEACATTNVNIRTGPSTRYSRVGRLTRGSCLPYRGLSRSGTWASVTYRGANRWISARYLNVRNSGSSSGGTIDLSRCLRAICQVESGCRPLGCRWDVNGIACGYYQIHNPYYIDCYQPGSGWRECSRDRSCAEDCVRAYLRRYATRCTRGRTPTCEDYARIHNGGPQGCRRSSTLGYWRHVQRYL